MEELIGAYPVLAPILVFVFWCSILWVIAQVSGWSALAEFYPAHDDFDGPKRNFRSIALERMKGAPASYNGVVTIGADPRGLRLSAFTLFRPYHPPLFIPWSEITSQPRKMLAFDGVELTFARGPGVRIRIARDTAQWAAEQSGGALELRAVIQDDGAPSSL